MKNILMVDNDRIFLFTISRLLEKEGHRVMAVDSGLKAIDALKAEVPDVILLDLVMPRIDGTALCRFIRNKEETRDTPIVIVSATSMEASRHKDRLDVNAWIAKATPRETARHILSVIDAPDLPSMASRSGKILVRTRVKPRSITRELLSIKQHFESVFDAMAEGIVEITDGGRVVYANSAALDLCGGSEKDLLGACFLDRFTPEARQKVAAVIHGQKRNGGSERSPIPIDLDGRWVEIHTLRVGEIRAASFIVILHDVTRAKRTEGALRAANAKLARQARELKASNDKLRQASEEKVRLEGQLILHKATRYLA